MNLFKKERQTFPIIARILDLILLFLSARGAIIIERIYHGKSWGGLDPQSFNFYSLFYIFIIWMILIHIFEHNLVYSHVSILHIMQNTALISFIGITTVITLDFLFKTDFFKRSTIIFFGLISFTFLSFIRSVWKNSLSFVYNLGTNPKNILIVGSKQTADRLIHKFREHREYGLNVASILDPDPIRTGKFVGGMMVSGDMSLFKRQIRELKIEDVFFTLNPKDIINVDSLFNYMDISRINYHLILDENIQERLSKPLQGIEPIKTNYHGISMLSYFSN